MKRIKSDYTKNPPEFNKTGGFWQILFGQFILLYLALPQTLSSISPEHPTERARSWQTS
jgi:hypothetical protein